jgi:hypothetical protein
MSLIPLDFPPGIQRDGTKLDSRSCVDGLHARFRMGRARKMLGRKQISSALAGIGRRVHCFYSGSQIIVHVGTSRSLEQIVLDRNGNFVSRTDRTPINFAGGLTPGWTLDALFDTTSDDVRLIAHSTQDLNSRADAQRSLPFLGKITDATPLVSFAPPVNDYGGTYDPPLLAGGIVCVQPFLFGFDLEGHISWSAPNDPSNLGVTGGSGGAGEARESAQKIVAGAPIRGGGANSPAALFWSLSEVISASFVGQNDGWFRFNTVSDQSTILSGASVVEYDGLYFWAGIDRFMVFNGTVVEIENRFNQDFFFDNMNWDHAGKAFAFKVPRFGEIWFCAPLFGSEEPNWAVIFNVREKCWYDTPLPNGGRSAAFFAQGFRYPVVCGVQQSVTGFPLWLHEIGLDEVVTGSAPLPIRSFIETPFLGGPMKTQPDDACFSFQQLEPDIQQWGDLTVYPVGGGNPHAADIAATPATLKGVPANPGEQNVGLKSSNSTFRYGRLHIESNTLGGNYVMGRPIVHGGDSQGTSTGAIGDPLTGRPNQAT